MKILSVVLVFFGEAANIYAEMKGAKLASSLGGGIVKIFSGMALVAAVGSAFTLAGYMIGLNAFKNIWVISAVAITSIVILEAMLAYLVVGQLPTRGALAGFVLGTIGLFVALMWE